MFNIFRKDWNIFFKIFFHRDNGIMLNFFSCMPKRFPFFFSQMMPARYPGKFGGTPDTPAMEIVCLQSIPCRKKAIHWPDIREIYPAVSWLLQTVSFHKMFIT
jgi:hypothetical protein